MNTADTHRDTPCLDSLRELANRSKSGERSNSCPPQGNSFAKRSRRALTERRLKAVPPRVKPYSKVGFAAARDQSPDVKSSIDKSSAPQGKMKQYLPEVAEGNLTQSEPSQKTLCESPPRFQISKKSESLLAAAANSTSPNRPPRSIGPMENLGEAQDTLQTDSEPDARSKTTRRSSPLRDKGDFGDGRQEKESRFQLPAALSQPHARHWATARASIMERLNSQKNTPGPANPLQEPLINAGYGEAVRDVQGNRPINGNSPWASNIFVSGVNTEAINADDTDTQEAPKSKVGSDAAEGRASANQSKCFSFVFVFPLPAVTTAEECTAFFQKHFPGNRSANAADLLEHVLMSPGIRKVAKFDKCRTLRELRNVTIEMLQSFLVSLAKSLEGQVNIFQFTSEDCDELFVCVEVSDKLGEKLACMTDYPLQLSHAAFDDLHLKLSDADLLPAYVGCGTYLSKDGWLKQFLQTRCNDSILRPVDTMRLLYDKITDYINLFELQSLGLLKHVYPAHDKDALLALKKTWANFRLTLSSEQPIDAVRDYFGEGVAFFFLFNGFINKALTCLLIPAILGELAWLCGFGDQAQAFLCIVLVVWSTCLVKFWRRTESFYVTKWGMERQAASATKDPINPRFKGEKMPSTLDENNMVLQAEPCKVVFGYTVSIVTSFMFTLFVIIMMEWNQQWQAVEQHKGKSTASLIGGLALSFQIQLWDKLWDKLIVGWLNDLEQHVTQYAYDQSRVAKTFAIKFINVFNAFWYIAFIQPQTDPEGCGGNCKEYLRQQLLIVMATYIGYGVVDVVLAYVGIKLPIWQEQRKIRQHGHKVFKVSLLEVQSKMCEYSGQDERDDYLSLVFPLAFVMLFGSMTPATIPLAWVAMSTQLRMHAWKMVDAVRRPFPSRSSGVGVWDPILTFISYAAVFNCIGLLVVQVDGLGAMVPGYLSLTHAIGMASEGAASKTLLFFILQNIVAICKLIFDFLVSDVTAKTQLERDRQIVQRVRISERGHAEFHETIELHGTNNIETCGFDKFPPLEPGHPNHVDALV